MKLRFFSQFKKYSQAANEKMEFKIGIVNARFLRDGTKRMELYAEELTTDGPVEIASCGTVSYEAGDNILDMHQQTAVDRFLAQSGWETRGRGIIVRPVEKSEANSGLEFCRITMEMEEIREGGFFRKAEIQCWWEVDRFTPEGRTLGYRTSEPWMDPDDEKKNGLRSNIASRLVFDDWSMTEDNRWFYRKIEDTQAIPSPSNGERSKEKEESPLEMIERLSALKESGAISEEDFERKKKELLDRI